MSEKISSTKLLLMILAFTVIIAFIGFLLYLVFFKPPVAPTITPEEKFPPTAGFPIAKEAEPRELEQEIPGILPKAVIEQIQEILQPITTIPDQVTEVAKGGITKSYELTSTPAISPTMSSDRNKIQLYNTEDSRFYTVDEFGNQVRLSDKQFFNVDNVAWSPQKEEGIIEYPDGSNILYNFTNETQVTLPRHWEEFSFSPEGQSISFLSYSVSPEDNWLAYSRPDGSQPQVLYPLGNRGRYVDVAWSPNNQVIATLREPIAGERQEIYFLGKNQENFPLTVVEGYGLRSEWSDDGKELLYSVYNSSDDNKPRLWVVNGSGNKMGSNRRKLPVYTFADRCTFDNENEYIYCAEPIDPPDYFGMLPGLLKTEGFDEFGNPAPIPSMIVKVNLKTGTKDILAIPDELTDITTVFLNEDESTLFYTDDVNQNIRKINLK